MPTTNPQSQGKENRPPSRHRPQSLPHPRRISHIPGPDPIDVLGSILGTPYHHDGPFEATLFARQIPGRAPVDALRESNAHTLAATPKASIADCLEGHYPLQGCAVLPPGEGGVGMYEEYDVMVRDGGLKRWGHMTYRDEDRKGKGEPAFTIDEFEKRQKAARAVKGGDEEGGYKGRGRSASTAGRLEGLSRLKKRLNDSLRRKMGRT
ncbi:hypothetical protein K440DRAFT_661774 [Wilcoxina mikolae CBS 423.85]|nr:hypothetical protein K440DRAFT_661774 [Wilcoxina mikolae CBS 423.85]